MLPDALRARASAVHRPLDSLARYRRSRLGACYLSGEPRCRHLRFGSSPPGPAQSRRRTTSLATRTSALPFSDR